MLKINLIPMPKGVSILALCFQNIEGIEGCVRINADVQGISRRLQGICTNFSGENIDHLVLANEQYFVGNKVGLKVNLANEERARRVIRDFFPEGFQSVDSSGNEYSRVPLEELELSESQITLASKIMAYVNSHVLRSSEFEQRDYPRNSKELSKFVGVCKNFPRSITQGIEKAGSYYIHSSYKSPTYFRETQDFLPISACTSGLTSKRNKGKSKPDKY